MEDAGQKASRPRGPQRVLPGWLDSLTAFSQAAAACAILLSQPFLDTTHLANEKEL